MFGLLRDLVYTLQITCEPLLALPSSTSFSATNQELNKLYRICHANAYFSTFLSLRLNLEPKQKRQTQAANKQKRNFRHRNCVFRLQALEPFNNP